MTWSGMLNICIKAYTPRLYYNFVIEGSTQPASADQEQRALLCHSLHSFLGINEDGVTSIVRTAGNPHTHVVLRGGRAKTNYDDESIRAAEDKLKSEKLPPVLMVDCSHANSEKKFAKQEDVWRSVIQQRIEGTQSLIGLMVESHLNEGNQPIPENLKALRYGVSITDSCIGWETTERMLRWGCEALSKAKPAVTSAA